MIDKALDRLARIIELVLAFAFIVAVVLNFTNVVGRYLFGLSLAGLRRGAGFHHGRHDVPRRGGRDPPQPASADGCPGPVHAGADAVRTADRRASPAASCSPALCSRNPTSTPARCCGSAEPATWPAFRCGFPTASSRSGFALILLIACWRLIVVVTGRETRRNIQRPPTARCGNDIRPVRRAGRRCCCSAFRSSWCC